MNRRIVLDDPLANLVPYGHIAPLLAAALDAAYPDDTHTVLLGRAVESDIEIPLSLATDRNVLAAAIDMAQRVDSAEAPVEIWTMNPVADTDEYPAADYEGVPAIRREVAAYIAAYGVEFVRADEQLAALLDHEAAREVLREIDSLTPVKYQLYAELRRAFPSFHGRLQEHGIIPTFRPREVRQVQDVHLPADSRQTGEVAPYKVHDGPSHDALLALAESTMAADVADEQEAEGFSIRNATVLDYQPQRPPKPRPPAAQ